MLEDSNSMRMQTTECILPEARPDQLRPDDGKCARRLARSARTASKLLDALLGCVHCCPGVMLAALHAHRLLYAALLRILHGCALTVHSAVRVPHRKESLHLRSFAPRMDSCLAAHPHVLRP